MFGAFTEGLQLFASFAMLMNFPRFNKMKGMGQIVTWIVRDESLHCEGMIKLFHAFAKETGALTQDVKDDIVECCRTVVAMEDKFIDLAFEMGPVQGMTPDDIKKYIRYIADWRLGQLGLPKIYGVDRTPDPVADGDPERRRARQLLRSARHRIFQGRHQGRLARRRRRLVELRHADGKAEGFRLTRVQSSFLIVDGAAPELNGKFAHCDPLGSGSLFLAPGENATRPDDGSEQAEIRRTSPHDSCAGLRRHPQFP